jgi:hypothetical protein
MNKGSEQQADRALNGLPPWGECELFCIADYAGTGRSPCGWRGLICDAQRDREMKILCPWCQHATLLRIPRGREDDQKA